jgi:hypothetical protein
MHKVKYGAADFTTDPANDGGIEKLPRRLKMAEPPDKDGDQSCCEDTAPT